MAKEPDTPEGDEPPEQPRRGPGMVVWLILGIVAAGGGFAVPYFLLAAPQAESEQKHAPKEDDNDGMSQDIAFVPFGEVTVNLDEGRLNRYLRVNITLQIDKADEESIAKLLELRKAMLRNWLLSHLSDKGMDDIRGASGQNRLRREIRDHFNTALFSDGYDRIYDVLFEEFNVQ
ncbi:MAG: flagellar basal body-associated FliL family protein [Planctomycetaceae bacterium]